MGCKTIRTHHLISGKSVRSYAHFPANSFIFLQLPELSHGATSRQHHLTVTTYREQSPGGAASGHDVQTDALVVEHADLLVDVVLQ